MFEQHGLCQSSPPAFALFAITFVAFGDVQTAAEIANYCYLMTDKLGKTVSSYAKTEFNLCCYVLCWTKLLHNLLNPLLEGYENGMATGDHENGLLCILVYIYWSFQSGQRLPLIQVDCVNYATQMKDLKQDFTHIFMIAPYQAALNLIGVSENMDRLEGDVLADLDKYLNGAKDLPMIVLCCNNFQIRLCTIFKNHEEGAKLYMSHGYDWPKVLPGHHMFTEVIFCGDISAFEMARMKKKGNYKKYALKARSTIQSQRKKGNPNVGHYEALLNAEHDALYGKHKSAEIN